MIRTGYPVAEKLRLLRGPVRPGVSLRDAPPATPDLISHAAELDGLFHVEGPPGDVRFPDLDLPLDVLARARAHAWVASPFSYLTGCMFADTNNLCEVGDPQIMDL